jgi:DNA-binding PadR family transcriptional regulator
MNQIENTILRILSAREDRLSYYQLDRKLSSEDLHHFLPTLRETLAYLSNEGYIIIEYEGNVAFYKITDIGRNKFEMVK